MNRLKICQNTRKINSHALSATIKKLWQKPFSEKQFKDLWLKNLQKNKNLFPSGWYLPPPDGITVLIASEKNPARLDYQSLRSKKYWPKRNIFFNHQTGLIFVYASPVDKKTGIFGDLGLTLYAGKNQKIINHIKKVYKINHELVKLIKPGIKNKILYQQANKMFKKVGLVNKVFSTTNPVGTDIGHSVPGTIDLYSKRELKVIKDNNWFEISQIISKKRVFLSQKENYVFKSGDCFTLEPSLLNPHSPKLPRVLFHTIVIIKENKATLLENFNEIFQATGMDYML